MADHHHFRHHSSVLESVESRAVKVADAGVVAHAMYFLFPLFLHHMYVMELVAILAVYQVDLAVLETLEVQEVLEVVDFVDQRGLHHDV